MFPSANLAVGRVRCAGYFETETDGLKAPHFQGVETTSGFNTRGQAVVLSLRLRLTAGAPSPRCAPTDRVHASLAYTVLRHRAITSFESSRGRRVDVA